MTAVDRAGPDISTTPPLWEDRTRPRFEDPLPAHGRVEVAVVGGGLTGLTTALLLARAGVVVAVLEARRVGSGTTGASTAKVSLLQGTKLSRIGSQHPLEVVGAYVEANREGQAWLREFCGTHGVEVTTRPAATYAASEAEIGAVQDEYDALRSVGLPVEWADSLDLPCPTYGAAVLDDQVQLDPMAVVHALAEQVRSHHGTLHERQRVRSVEQGDRVVLHLEDGRMLHADRVVIATGSPSLTGGLSAATMSPRRSYLIALQGAESVPGMLISAGDRIRSMRTAHHDGADLLLVGGSGHLVGRVRSEAAHLDELRSWSRKLFPGSIETHAWSAQDYSPYDELPQFGPVRGTGERIHQASGYDKWGMTNAVAAARAISADLLGEPASWARALQGRRLTARGVVGLTKLGVESGIAQVRGVVGAELNPLPRDVPEGSGVVGRSGLIPAGVSRVDGARCAVSAICTHLGGILRWNDREESWDCPLHGSRFTAGGEVIEGPASGPLARIGERGHQPPGSGRPSA